MDHPCWARLCGDLLCADQPCATRHWELVDHHKGHQERGRDGSQGAEDKVEALTEMGHTLGPFVTGAP